MCLVGKIVDDVVFMRQLVDLEMEFFSGREGDSHFIFFSGQQLFSALKPKAFRLNKIIHFNSYFVVDAIIEKNEEIVRLNEDIQNIKNKRVCPECNANVDANSSYCNNCGVKLD